MVPGSSPGYPRWNNSHETNRKISSNGCFFLFYLEPHMYYVYILKGDKKHYIGITKDLERRLSEHKSGKNSTTRTMWNLSLLKSFWFSTRQEAAAHEKKIKQSGHIDRRI